jgi:hypothetical protein
MKHELKTLPEYFSVSWAGHKNFEIRKNDRDFKVWDEIALLEFDAYEELHTGREIHGIIDYITDFKLQKGYVVFSYEERYRRDG